MRSKISILKLIVFLTYCVSYVIMGKGAETLQLTAGYSKPPFVIENNEQYSGIQLDLISEIFAVENQAVNFIHVPLARSFSSVDKWHSDGTITLPITHERKNVFLSEPYISYQNVVVTLTEDKIKIDELNDFSGKYITAFQTARKFLGEHYTKAIKHAQDYQEMADQMKQIELLFMKRTQVLVLDINILKHFLFTNRDDKYNKPYTIHQLFMPRVYAAGFKSQTVRDQFNRGLAVIKANGTYQKVIDKYLL